MIIKYVVVRIYTNGRGTEETYRCEFDNVEDAISLHIEKKGDYDESTYWDLVVEYD